MGNHEKGMKKAVISPLTMKWNVFCPSKNHIPTLSHLLTVRLGWWPPLPLMVSLTVKYSCFFTTSLRFKVSQLTLFQMRGSVFLRFQDLGKEGLTSTATSRLSCFVFLCQQKSKIRFNWVGQSRYHQLVKSYPSWFTIGTIVTILMIIWKVGCIRLDPHCEEHFGAGLGDVRVPGNHHWPDDQGWDQCNPWQIEWSLSAS